MRLANAVGDNNSDMRFDQAGRIAGSRAQKNCDQYQYMCDGDELPVLTV